MTDLRIHLSTHLQDLTLVNRDQWVLEANTEANTAQLA